MYEVRQQYSGKPEQVPSELNLTGRVLYLNRLNPAEVALLFRDMGLGDLLVTEEIAERARRLGKNLTDLSNQEFQAMLSRLPSLNKPEVDFI